MNADFQAKDIWDFLCAGWAVRFPHTDFLIYIQSL